MIEMKNVCKTYSMGDVKVDALRGIDLKIKKGEFVSVMGPSGSGKSTILHMIGLLDKQTKGNIILNNKNVSNFDDDKRTEFRLKNIGFVFQFYSLVPELTALENTFLPNMLTGKEQEECIKNSKDVLEKLGIGHRLSNYPHQLSGGEQQRVAIARALINNPQLLLADEPTAALDSKNSVNVINIFKKLNEEEKHTIVLITHEEELGKKADRGIWLRDGLIDKEKKF